MRALTPLSRQKLDQRVDTLALELYLWNLTALAPPYAIDAKLNTLRQNTRRRRLLDAGPRRQVERRAEDGK